MLVALMDVLIAYLTYRGQASGGRRRGIWPRSWSSRSVTAVTRPATGARSGCAARPRSVGDSNIVGGNAFEVSLMPVADLLFVQQSVLGFGWDSAAVLSLYTGGATVR